MTQRYLSGPTVGWSGHHHCAHHSYLLLILPSSPVWWIVSSLVLHDLDKLVLAAQFSFCFCFLNFSRFNTSWNYLVSLKQRPGIGLVSSQISQSQICFALVTNLFEDHERIFIFWLLASHVVNSVWFFIVIPFSLTFKI